MKTFMAVYIGTASAQEKSRWQTADAAKRKELEVAGIKAWTEWMATNKGVIVDQGGPLGKTLRTSAQGVAATKNNISGYVILQAETHEAAAKTV